MHAVIFDMDGTLFQTDSILEASLDDAFNYLRSQKEWDKETPIEQYREIMGMPLQQVWETLMPNHTLEMRERIDTYFFREINRKY